MYFMRGSSANSWTSATTTGFRKIFAPILVALVASDSACVFISSHGPHSLLELAVGDQFR